jgi:chemotaxis protein histidine kinase CheA
MDRYTELHRISRELVEIAADINAAGTELDGLYDNFDQSLSRQSRIATDLQDRMMEVRLVPVSTIAARLYRAVRGVAQRRSRQVELVIEGEAVEIDKVLLEEITDPLLHLVRNAADHGIESPQERIARGKPASGTVRLSAAREGNEAVIRVTDDGAGIDLDRVLEKALARGVIRRRDGMTREQILDLIFLPGFSTSATISDISGRGVGLDVVRTNVRRLKGTIDVESTPGEGTTFIIRLPIMLAVTRALLIRSGSQTFATPCRSSSRWPSSARSRSAASAAATSSTWAARPTRSSTSAARSAWPIPAKSSRTGRAPSSSATPTAGSPWWWTNWSASRRSWSSNSDDTCNRSPGSPGPPSSGTGRWCSSSTCST